MRGFAAIVAGVVVGAAGLLGVRAAAAPEEGKAPAAAPCFAVVNVAKVFAAIPRAKTVVEGLQHDADALKASLTERETDLSKRADDVENRLARGTPDYAAARRALAAEAASVEYDRKEGLKDIYRRQVQGMADIYRSVCAEAERIAGERGFSAVLNYDPEPIRIEERDQVMDMRDLRLQMALRPVLWARPDIDLTKDVIDALSREAPAEGPGEKK